MVYIFYVQNVVSLHSYFKYTKIGGTLPAFKNEIKDFFFTRLGTGGIFNPPLQRRTHTSTKKHLGVALFPRYFYYIFHLNSSLKWMNNAALQ